MQPLGHTQNPLRNGVIELAVGEPDPALLPQELVRSAAHAALADERSPALAYGPPQGPASLRRALARRISERDGCAAGADDVLVTGGNSQALELLLTALTSPGDVVLVEAATYGLALAIMRDHPVEALPVPIDGDGLDVAALGSILRGLRAEGRRARLLYIVPTYHNPTGACLAPARRTRLLALARDHDLVIVEDDVYRELAYDGAPPRSLWSEDTAAPVVRLGSFSKSLAPGLRVGWANAPQQLLARLLGTGMLESGGCVSQFAAHVAARVLEAGAYDDHLVSLQRAYRERRNALAAALREHLPAGCGFALPAGGFFVWLELPRGLRASELLPTAEARGVSFAPGGRFRPDGRDDALRLAFSLYEPQALAEGARRLGAAIHAHLSGRA